MAGLGVRMKTLQVKFKKAKADEKQAFQTVNNLTLEQI